MEIKKIRRVCLVLLCIGVTGIVGSGKKDVNSKKHEPITFMAPYMDVDSFIKEVHKTYPEVNLKVVPYSGANTTVYLNTIMEENDLPDMIRSLKGRIHFAHVRNLKFNSPTDFEEAAHLSSDGTFDMYEIMLALYDIGFDGPIRPDHGRMIWDEVAMPGYGLYDRALGATYLNGLWEAVEKSHKQK